ncbi:[acyl-carrier-protein] S-malonyltransferase [Kaistia soli DSM 19436]|uniref:[acyl-carrier-protein] S-malonyltransferase n=1 Tax=Kaistia soli DSM 19436 TaxID=1122133 RepID=A0A1M5L3K4_9HYPH|nr:acyltransferase domain-containing protein [Kaistia soli]SHG59672.1 [acyl-carrier-protein] S-malonyltransferase [Kaistia soli DSM 19436]
MPLAILCSGQAHQGPDMFALTADAPVAQLLFSLASALLGGRDPRRMVLEADATTLQANRTGQILCVLQGLAAAATLADVMPDSFIVAGYSIGELTAWGVAAAIAPADVLRLAAERAELMDAASRPGEGLLALRGLDEVRIAQLATEHDAAVAIVNPGGGVILGGSANALSALSADAVSAGAYRVVRLPVAVASHTPRLADAARQFRIDLAGTTIDTRALRRHRLLSGIDGQAVFDPDAGLDKLAAQISRTVHWNACLQACLEAGATAFLELGPGHALAEMAAGAYCMPARSISEFAAMEGVRAWVKTR